MLTMDPYALLLIVGFLYVLVFGALSYMRREGLSLQFALEGVGLTVILVGGSYLLKVQLSPILYLVLLYLITMRSRLVADAANLLAKRENYSLAFRLYNLGLAWWPDSASRLIILTNKGAAQLRSGQVEAAIATLESVLEAEKRHRLGIKYEAACRYNLGYAYELSGEDAKAVAQYNETTDVFPGSVYAKAAEASLKRRKREGSGG
jgi:tetratricopeptide (TPR) repeat protein